MKLRNLILPIALTLGYSGVASANNVYGKGARLDNGVIAMFKMDSERSICELNLIRYGDADQVRVIGRIELLDTNCDWKIDKINFTHMPGQEFVRSFHYKKNKRLFDTADRLYNKTVKQHGLRKYVENKISGGKGILEHELESFFK